MLPFTKDRTTLRSYQGSSIVMSSRVACMPPVVSGEVRSFLDSTTTRRYGYMTGQIMYEDSLERADLGSSKDCSTNNCSTIVPFSCNIPNQIYDYQPVVAAFCFPKTLDPQLFTFNWTLDDNPWTSDVPMILVFSSNIDSDGWALMDNHTTALPESRTRGEWQSFDFGMNREINMTLCFNGMNAMLSNVSLTTKTNLVEPKIRYGLNVSNTENVRRFLGADPSVQDLEDRGVLVMDTIVDPSDHVFGVHFGIDDGDWYPESEESTGALEFALIPMKANQTIPGCDMCEGDFEGTARDFTRIFLDTLTSTNRAAVAIQTVYRMLAQSVHDQLLDYLTLPTPVKVVQTVTSTVPTSFNGLITVAVLILVNDLCVLSLAALYMRHTRYTMIGDFWHAMSQMVGTTTERILDKSNLSKDSRIFEEILEEREYVQLEKSAESGRIEIVRLRDTINAPSVLRWVSKVYQGTRKLANKETSRLSKTLRSRTQKSASGVEREH
ncbi:hypothetical protein BJ166DRAFT_505713 [Pestalotiopsis sp. NC0098]|nr:hypothetical protein BJ166DRAFT_505713 [Pestalotiopsis sp. NC0098]